MLIKGIIQGSSLWHDERAKRIGASEVSNIMGSSYLPSRNPTTLYKEKKGLAAPFVMNDVVQYGMDNEDGAREFFEKIIGKKFVPEVYAHDDYPFLGASLDGISEDGEILEIKCPTEKTLEKVSRGYLACYYYTQIQAAMLCSDTYNAHYFVFAPGRGGYHFTVPRCEEYCQEIIFRGTKFWNEFYLKDICPVASDFGIDDSKLYDEFKCPGMNSKFEAFYPTAQDF